MEGDGESVPRRKEDKDGRLSQPRARGSVVLPLTHSVTPSKPLYLSDPLLPPP